MNAEQMAKAKALYQHVRFLPGSFDKRFCRNLATMADETPEAELTVKQAALLDMMWRRYRKQLRQAVAGGWELPPVPEE